MRGNNAEYHGDVPRATDFLPLEFEANLWEVSLRRPQDVSRVVLQSWLVVKPVLCSGMYTEYSAVFCVFRAFRGTALFFSNS